MPKNIRNFWVELSASGRKTRIATGPRGKEGGINITVKVRDKGEIRTVGVLTGMCFGGILQLSWFPDPHGQTAKDMGTDKTLLYECQR